MKTKDKQKVSFRISEILLARFNKEILELPLARDQFLNNLIKVESEHLAKELEWVIENKVPKILHIAGREIVSKYDFGYNLCKELNLNLSLIVRGKLNQKGKIKRSRDQTLDSFFYRSISKHRLPDLEDTIKILVKNFK